VRDRWAEWLLERRFGGDPELRERFLGELARTRDRVLDNAGLAAGETLLDVGCGDGLIAFGALERGAAEVLFADVSQDLLDESRRIAEELGAAERCRFLLAPAEDLSAVADASVDVVTTRSVLIYVKEKRRAFEEFFRVLRPGGRLSLFEPINSLNRFGHAFDVAAVQELEDRVRAVYERLQPRGSDPMTDFDDRDLVDLAEAVGFPEIHLALDVEVKAPEPMRWDAFVRTAWNPNIPTLAEVMEDVMTPDEAARYTAELRPLVEEGRGSRKMAWAYLRTRKSG
jgi:SAM-dependent methyltransferase